MSEHKLEAWIVCAEWVNSSSTYHGPFESADDAYSWALAHLVDDKGCSQWDVALLSPVSSAVAS